MPVTVETEKEAPLRAGEALLAGPVRVSLECAVQAAGGTGQLDDQFTDLQPLLCGPEVERLWKRCTSVGNKAHRNLYTRLRFK